MTEFLQNHLYNSYLYYRDTLVTDLTYFSGQASFTLEEFHTIPRNYCANSLPEALTRLTEVKQDCDDFSSHKPGAVA